MKKSRTPIGEFARALAAPRTGTGDPAAARHTVKKCMAEHDEALSKIKVGLDRLEKLMESSTRRSRPGRKRT